MTARVGARLLLVVWGCLACHACGDAPEDRQTRRVASLAGPDILRAADPAQLAAGYALYRQYCADCHGEHAEGASDWRRRGADGFYPPPPLDGSGHAWHHPQAWLQTMIRDGSPPGQGRMPAWGARLGAAEIDAVIAWFQSLWPDPVYAAWHDREAGTSASRR